MENFNCRLIELVRKRILGGKVNNKTLVNTKHFGLIFTPYDFGIGLQYNFKYIGVCITVLCFELYFSK